MVHCEEQNHRIFIVSKTSLENLPRSSLEILISSIFCKYVSQETYSFICLHGAYGKRADSLGKSALLSRRSLGITITKSYSKHKNWKDFSQLWIQANLSSNLELPHLPVESLKSKLIILATNIENLFSFRLRALPTLSCLILRYSPSCPFLQMRKWRPPKVQQLVSDKA